MTLRNPLSRASRLLIAAVVTCLSLTSSAQATTVRGTVKMPDASRSTRLYHGYWRLDNGNVPVQTPAARRPRRSSCSRTSRERRRRRRARSPSSSAASTRARAWSSPVPGSVIELKNTGKVRHELSTPDTPRSCSWRRCCPGATRRQRFDRVGGYVIRDSEYPHIMISVIIVGTTFFSAVDEKGALLDRQRARRHGHPEGLDARQVGRRAADRHGHARQGRADDQGRLPARAAKAEQEAKAAE